MSSVQPPLPPPARPPAAGPMLHIAAPHTPCAGQAVFRATCSHPCLPPPPLSLPSSPLPRRCPAGARTAQVRGERLQEQWAAPGVAQERTLPTPPTHPRAYVWVRQVSGMMDLLAGTAATAPQLAAPGPAGAALCFRLPAGQFRRARSGQPLASSASSPSPGPRLLWAPLPAATLQPSPPPSPAFAIQ